MVEKISGDFLTPAGGAGTAAHYNTYITAYAPLAFPQLFLRYGKDSKRPKEKLQQKPNQRMDFRQLDALMNLCQLQNLLIRPVISKEQIKQGELLAFKYSKAMHELYPSLTASPNFHQVTHIARNIRQYGPVYGIWCYAGERLNKWLKNLNTNHHETSTATTMMRMFNKGCAIGPLYEALMEPTYTSTERLQGELLAQIQSRFSRETERHKSKGTQVVVDMVMEDSRNIASQISHAGFKYRHVPFDISKWFQTGRLTPQELELMRQCIDRPGNAPGARPARNLSESADGSSVPIIAAVAQMHDHIKVNRSTFRGVATPITAPLIGDDILVLQDCVFEYRSSTSVYTCRPSSQSLQAGIISKIVSHRTVSADGTVDFEGVYLFFNVLQRFEGTDPYSYFL